MKIRSDSVSERYRKYIIKIKVSSGTSYYLLWGTDCANPDFDYILLNPSNEILVFEKIADLLRYVKGGSEKKIDETNTKLWAEEYRLMKSYCTYDLESIRDTLSGNVKKAITSKDKGFAIVDFINLFSDLAYQTNERRLIKIVNEKNTRKFIDYVYANFFWDNQAETNASLEYDENLFKQNIYEMILIFTERMRLANKMTL